MLAATAVGGLASAALAAGSTQVETLTLTGRLDVAMPGNAGGGNTVFSGAVFLNTLDFTPGPVTFNGQPVDFDGREAQFIAGTYNLTVSVPAIGGPATVAVPGTGSTGGGGGGGGGCSTVQPGVQLGPGFGENSLQVLPGPVNGNTYSPSWDSNLVPPLLGHGVNILTNLNVTSVDPVNGIVNFTGTGSIVAANDVVPALGWLGLFCLATGLLGFGILVLRRRWSLGGTKPS
jgi:hypothetical protein